MTDGELENLPDEVQKEVIEYFESIEKQNSGSYAAIYLVDHEVWFCNSILNNREQTEC